MGSRRAKIIGLCGSHRTGKTTLAKLFAERAQVEFLETKSSKVFEDLGLDPKADYDMKQRLYIQRKILESASALYSNARNIFITDRTPLDMMAYTLADVTRENVDGELASELLSYTRDCLDILNRTFAVIMVVQPGIKLVDEEGKAPANEAYIEHLNHLIMGIVAGEGVKCNHFYIPRHMTDLEDRFSALSLAVQRTEEKFQSKVSSGEIVFH